jgi:adenosine deaminase
MVRHAEKMTDNPEERIHINLKGTERAEALGQLMRQENIQTIYATDYKRQTQQLNRL